MTQNTLPIDLYWSFRSPYSYLALQKITDIEARRDVVFTIKIVLPLAIREPGFFDSRGPAWTAYLLRDVVRLAQMTGQPIAMPNPDPVVQNMLTREVAAEQPYIARLSRLGLLATDAGHGLAFITAVSQLIWSGEKWMEGTALADAIRKTGLSLDGMDALASNQAEILDARLAQHDADLRAEGHWGVPTCVLKGEPFFGMDRLDVLEWRLDELGI